MLVLWRLLAVLAVCAGLSWVAGAARAELVKRSAAVDRSPMTEIERTAATALAARWTVRVSSTGCDKPVVGSGFVLDGRESGSPVFESPVLDRAAFDHLLVTNSHIVSGADSLSIDHGVAQGPALAGPSERTRRELVPVLLDRPTADLAVAPWFNGGGLAAADRPPSVGEPVVVAGFGGGDRLSVTRARVHAIVDGGPYGSEDRVLLLNRPSARGASGGPVLDRRGSVVGVVRATETTIGLTVAVSLAELTEATRSMSMNGIETRC